jgi:hypothetical protein
MFWEVVASSKLPKLILLIIIRECIEVIISTLSLQYHIFCRQTMTGEDSLLEMMYIKPTPELALFKPPV